MARPGPGPAPEVSADRTEISGSWQKSVDGGRTWEHDFTVRYTRRGEPG